MVVGSVLAGVIVYGVVPGNRGLRARPWRHYLLVAGGAALDLERLAVSLAGLAESGQVPDLAIPRIGTRQARTGPAGDDIRNLSGRISLKTLTQLTPKYYCRVIQTHSRFFRPSWARGKGE
jgi:hypothetical protein